MDFSFNLHAMEKRKFDVGECSRSATKHKSSEGVDDGPILESKHKIFLSHSGVQKEFVEHLCQALEDHCRYPFFDRRPESLPKGKEFPNLIIKAARQCQLFVVVVSEEYFMSKWPMIELNAFVQAKKVMKTNEIVAILPLFYGLSVGDLKDEKRRQRWLEKWEAFVKDDPIEGRIKVEDWCYALDELTKFNGLPYDRELKEIVAYENDIVSHICDLIPPDVKWDDSHIQGNVHEVLLNKMQQIGLSRMYKVKVVGIYGVGGIGKTIACKTLCNELSSKYEGRVCHIEFDGTCSNSKELWQNAVVKLTRKSADFVRQLDEGECVNVIYKTIHKQPTFLAIDNVWDNYNSIKKAKMFLESRFHEDSLVLVTARSQNTLALLGINGGACLDMLELGEGDAKRLFLYYAARGEQFTIQEDIDSIVWCIKKCYFCKGGEENYHHHPLALEALGRQLCCYGKKPSEWVQRLSEVWKPSSFFGENVVFNVLQSSFDLLPPNEQTLFMDVGFFLRCLEVHYALDFIPWMSLKEQLCLLYRTSEKKIQSQLDSLKQKGLLQVANLELGRITMYDLYHEFLIYEAEGKLGGTMDMLDRKWVLVKGDHGDLSELEVAPPGERWYNLSRLYIWQTVEIEMDEELWLDPASSDHSPTNLITDLECIEWQYFSNVLVLHLFGLKFGHGSLNLKGMKCLRRLQLLNCDYNCLMTLEGLESLRHLTFFEWRGHQSDDRIDPHFVGQFPSSLKYLHIDEPCILPGSNVLAHYNKLIKLKLVEVEVGELLDLSNCSSLESLEMSCIRNLESILGLSSSLHTLDICEVFGIHILELNQLDGLVRLEVVNCYGWEMPCLLSLTKLQVLRINEHSEPLEHCIPHQIRELHYELCTHCEAPCLNVFKQLQVLDFSYSRSLILMYGLGDLLALRSLNLYFCSSLEQLPNLSKSKSLEKLKLNYCGVLKLYEEDFEILASLPLLQPMVFTIWPGSRTFMLDVVGQKVLRSQEEHDHLLSLDKDEWEKDEWKDGEWDSWEGRKWEEPKFAPLPIKFEDLRNWIPSMAAPHPLSDLEKCESDFANNKLKRPKYL